MAWIFWITLIALPAALAAYRLVPASPTAGRAHVDWAGAALLSAALAAVLLAVTEANDWGWGSVRTLGLMGGGLALLLGWTRFEATRAEPLIDLRVLRSRPVAATNLTGFFIGVAMFSSFLLIPQFAQTPEDTGYGFGSSVTESGLLLAPAALAQLIAGPLAGKLGARIGFRTTLTAGGAFATAAFLFLALDHRDPWNFLVTGALLGTGISFAFASMANLIVGAVAQEDVGIATGINTVTRTVGGAFGSAISTAILVGHLIPGTALPTEGAYTVAFLLSAAGGLLAIVAARFVPAPRGGARGPARAGAGPALSDTVPACLRSTPSGSTAASPSSRVATAASVSASPARSGRPARASRSRRATRSGPRRWPASWMRSRWPRDVTDPGSVEAMLARVTDELGPVDVLVNNAGLCFHRPALEVPAEEWRAVWDVNVDGLWHCSRIVGAQMVERGTGAIVNIGSMSAEIVNRPQWQPAYNASKAAVHHLTRSLAAEWAPFGVRVNALAPGYVKTEMSPVDEPQFQRYWIEDAPMRRYATPEELGPSLLYLASDASSFTTGAVLVVDGGYTLH